MIDVQNTIWNKLCELSVSTIDQTGQKIISDIPRELCKRTPSTYKRVAVYTDFVLPSFWSPQSLNAGYYCTLFNDIRTSRKDVQILALVTAYRLFVAYGYFDRIKHIPLQNRDEYTAMGHRLALHDNQLYLPYTIRSPEGIQRAVHDGYLSPIGLRCLPDGYVLDTVHFPQLYTQYRVLNGRARFGRDMRLTHVVHNGIVCNPQDPRVVEQVLVSLFSYQVLVVHAGFLHLTISNQITVASIQYLPSTHPLRILLHPTEHRVLETGDAIGYSVLSNIGIPLILPVDVQASLHRFQARKYQSKLVQQIILDPLKQNDTPLLYLKDAQTWYHACHTFCRTFIDAHVDFSCSRTLAWFSAVYTIHPQWRTLDNRSILVDLCTWAYYVNVLHEMFSVDRTIRTIDPFFGIVPCRDIIAQGDKQVPLVSKAIHMRLLTIMSTTRYNGISMMAMVKAYTKIIPYTFRSPFEQFERALIGLNEGGLKTQLLLPRHVECSIGW